MLRSAYRILKAMPNTTRISLNGKGERLNVVGDLHGQLPDLLHILEEAGPPSETNKYDNMYTRVLMFVRYIFNGDFVDRGPMGVEVCIILLAFFAAHPSTFLFFSPC